MAVNLQLTIVVLCLLPVKTGTYLQYAMHHYTLYTSSTNKIVTEMMNKVVSAQYFFNSTFPSIFCCTGFNHSFPLLTDLECWLMLCVDGVHQSWGSRVVLHARISSRRQQGGCHLSPCTLHTGIHQSSMASPVLCVWICLLGPQKN